MKPPRINVWPPQGPSWVTESAKTYKINTYTQVGGWEGELLVGGGEGRRREGMEGEQ